MAQSNVTLLHGDCLDLMSTIPDHSIDAIIADPPYGTTACKWDSVIPFNSMWAHLKRIIKPRGAIVLFGSQPFTSALVMSNVKWFRHQWVWDKKMVFGGANARIAPMKAHEDIIVFSENAARYFPQMSDWTEDEIKRKRKHDVYKTNKSAHDYRPYCSAGREKQISKGKHPNTILRINALGSCHPERAGHPTQKPVALMEYLIKTYTNEGETVLDFTMGSGTTGVAAVNTGRNFIGIERDDHYFTIAQKRIQEAQDKQRGDMFYGAA